MDPRSLLHQDFLHALHPGRSFRGVPLLWPSVLAAQQLASSLSGTSGGKSKKKTAKKKLASCCDSLTQLLVLALDFELPKTKEEAPLSAPAASPACSPFLPLELSPSSSVGSPSLPPVLQVNPLLRAAGDGGLVSPVDGPSRCIVKRSPRALPYSASPSLKASCSPGPPWTYAASGASGLT